MLTRTRFLNSKETQPGPLVYWMVRDQRAHNNWALLYAQHQALATQQPVYVIFCCRPNLKKHAGTRRMLDWMLTGLEEVASELAKHNISFHFLVGDPLIEALKFCEKVSAGEIVLDFSPLRIYQNWATQLAENSRVRVTQLDAHNIVPCWLASPKQEFAARTIRPKLHALLPKFLRSFPALLKHPIKPQKLTAVNWKKIRQAISVDENIGPVNWAQSGSAASQKILKTFITQRLPSYHLKRNDPTQDILSNLSPYLHFGQLSAQQVALAIEEATAPAVAKDSFLDELIIRRELADNYCFYNSEYDAVHGFPKWAQLTLQKHSTDEREYIYTPKQLELAQTHDPIWNAAQLEMLKTGKMHGYMRMYWAKKILEWTQTPEEALAIAINLNDRYELDGRDPNGYVGIAWSIGGVHDRPWFERPIFGAVRYMSAAGLSRKFDTDQYMNRWQNS